MATFPVPPLGPLPGKVTPAEKIVAAKTNELIGGANDLDARLKQLTTRVAALEAIPVPPPPPPPPPPEPTPEPVPEPTPTPEPTPEPTPTPTPPPPTGSTPELPRVTPIYAGPTPARIINVAAGGDVQAALNTARGENVEIRLAAGATYVGNFSQSSRGDGWLTLKGMNATQGTRVRPSTSAPAPKLLSPNVDPTLKVTGTQFRVDGVDIQTAPTGSNIAYSIVSLEPGAAEIAVVGCYIHGQPESNVQRAVALNSAATVIVDSWISCHVKGIEGQGIASWTGPGPYLIRNNTVEASGINFMIGGSTPSVVGLRCYDVTVSRNHFHKPLAWKGVWTVKNLLETKNAGRVLIEDNVLENSWTDAQTGIGVLFKSSNDQGTCDWCQTTDVTYRRNLLRNVETGINITAGENYCIGKPAAEVGPNQWCQVRGSVPPPTSRVLIQDSVFEDMGNTSWGGRAIYVGPVHSTVGVNDLTIERIVTAQGAGKLISHGLIMLQPGAQRAVFRDCVLSHGFYSLTSEGSGGAMFGIPALTAGAPNAVWSNITFVKSPNHTESQSLPAGTTVVSAEPALAAQIRATVAAATAGVVVPP